MSPITYAEILSARERIAPYARRTPVMTSSGIDELFNACIFFKCENFQKTGSFKFRGALNAVASLSPDERGRGVVTHSSGNHGQALARAAQEFQIPAYIVVPNDAPREKVDAIRSYGGEVIPCEPTARGREETAAEVRERTGAIPIDSHDDPLVIAGQGTAAIELLEETGPLDMILVPVGGGGLISGTAIAAGEISPETEVIGCEPAGADDAYRSLREGRRITDFTPQTIADGLRTPLGHLTFSIMKERIRRIVRVSDEEIVAAMRLAWERLKIVIEPSGGVPLAALIGGELPAAGRRIGVILSGGNISAERLACLFSVGDNRRVKDRAG